MMRTLPGLKRLAFYSLLCCALLTASAGWLAAQTQVPPPRASSPAGATSTLKVQITGIRNATGKIRLALYRDSAFVENREAEIDVRTLSAKTVFEKLPRGVYAVYIFHDENMNGKMDNNFVGMPVEGYGMSNNPHKRMGRPGFDETNFQVNQPESAIEIRMIYWQ